MFLYPYPSTHAVHFPDAHTWNSESRISFATTPSELLNNRSLGTTTSLSGLSDQQAANLKAGQSILELGNAITQIPSTTATIPTLGNMQQQSPTATHLIAQEQKPMLGFLESANGTSYSVKEQCKSCGENILQADLIQHMRNHMGPRRCEVCHYEAPTKHHLREHMNTHTGLKPYKCNFCEKCFAAKNSLRVHTMYLHTKIRAHQCHHCDQRFVTTSERKSHELVHTDKCPICQMSFRLRGHLRQHMKVHANTAFHHKKR